MRVVLDTNILVSALMIQTGNPAAIYRAWQEGQFTLLTCAEHLDELRATLRKPAIVPRIKPYKAGGVVNEIRKLAECVDTLPRVRRSPDPTDDFLLALSEAGQARLSSDRRQERVACARTSQRHADRLRARIRGVIGVNLPGGAVAGSICLRRPTDRGPKADFPRRDRPRPGKAARRS
jgi:uncharacterized protein